MKRLIQKITHQEDINFLLTNRLPRITLTKFMGWFSQIENPWVARISIWIWRQFSDLDLSEAKKSRFTSMHDCFIRELKPGIRTIHPGHNLLISPCDAIVGAHGVIEDGALFQAKGFPYRLEDLLGEIPQNYQWQKGIFVTLRLKSSMYHRFHAPCDGKLTQIKYFSGDTWNVNPIALKRIEKLFCKNERAFFNLQINNSPYDLALIAVAAILVASIRVHGVDELLHLDYNGPATIPCDISFKKGDELGWFQHGSTIILLAPPGFRLDETIHEGLHIQMGEPLFKHP